jgi:hypothetical protein
MAKPTSADPAAVDPTRHALKGAGDSLKATDENTDPDADPGSAAVDGIMTIYEIDTMGSDGPTDLFDGGVLADRRSSEGEASGEE